MNPNQTTLTVISGIVVLGFGGVVMAWMVWPPVVHSELLAALTAALCTGYLQVINYWFPLIRSLTTTTPPANPV